MHAFGEAQTNVAEGYPSWPLTPTQRRIVDRLPQLMLSAQSTPYSEL